MHILVVNDDGPPSPRYSPYILPFVRTLQEAGHLVSVAIPAASRSWISKAHLIEASLTATYVPPSTFSASDGFPITTTNGHPQPNHNNNNNNNSTNPREWDWVILQNGTPASCTQLGLYTLFPTRPPIDLVISGPNHGRNASKIYNLSSGTVGGALEAATCGTRGIALSFGSKDPQATEVVIAAARLAVRVIGYLESNWDDRVEVYNVNVPMRVDVEDRPVRYTAALENFWSRGCLYAEVEGENDTTTTTMVNGDGAGKKALLNGTGCSVKANGVNGAGVRSHSHLKQRRFAWSADLSDMKNGLLSAGEGTDAHTVLNGCTSVTPLRASFCHVSGLHGEIRL